MPSLIDYCVMYRPQQFWMMMDWTGLKWTLADCLGLTLFSSDACGTLGHGDIILFTAHRRLTILLIHHCLLELRQLSHHSH